MSYAIVWRSRAMNQMSALVAAHPERTDEFAAGLRAIVAELKADPEGAGESRDAGYRVLTGGPFTVYTEPTPDRQMVYITRVHLPR